MRKYGIRDIKIPEVGEQSGLSSSAPSLVLSVPQDFSLVETVLGEITCSWTDVVESVDGYKIYRRETLVGGSWGTSLSTIAEAVQVYTDTTVASDTQYDYKVVAYDGLIETIGELFGENYQFITSTEIIPGLLFADGDRMDLPSTKTYVGAFNFKIGIQGLTDPTGSTGLIGTAGGVADRILMSFSLNKVRANIGTGSLASSPLLSPAMDLSGRKIIEIYREAGGDMYIVDGDNPAQFLFNQPNDFDVAALYVAGGFGTTGYLWYFNDEDNEFLFNEGSGLIVSSVDTLVDLDIVTTGDLTYVNDTMWTAALPPPTGFITVNSLSVGGRPTDVLSEVINAEPVVYTPGEINYQIAELYNVGDHNPEAYTHAIITTMTNDIANPTKFLTPDEYETALTDVVQKLKTAGITPIICTAGAMITATKQAEKDFDATIGAMLSGDPMNPTPESGWDFNSDLGATVDAVTPLYVAKALAVSIAESVTFIDTFQHFIDGGTYPAYGDWVTADGIHYSATGYSQYGIAVAAVLDTLGWTGVEKVCVLGDSLGNGITTEISVAYNS